MARKTSTLRHRDRVSETQQPTRRGVALGNELVLVLGPTKKRDDIGFPVRRSMSKIRRIDDRLLVTVIWKFVLNGLEVSLRCERWDGRKQKSPVSFDSN